MALKANQIGALRCLGNSNPDRSNPKSAGVLTANPIAKRLRSKTGGISCPDTRRRLGCIAVLTRACLQPRMSQAQRKPRFHRTFAATQQDHGSSRNNALHQPVNFSGEVMHEHRQTISMAQRGLDGQQMRPYHETGPSDPLLPPTPSNR